MKRKAIWALRHGAGVIITIIFLLPLYWIFTASLRQVGLPPPTSIEWWPQSPTLDNYPFIFDLLPMTRYIRNSLIVVATAVPITVFVASIAGFGMSQEEDLWRRRLLITSVILLMVPGASVWLFRFQILRWLGWIDTLWALIAPAFAAGNPLFVLLFFWSYRRIPAEIHEAARLDGASAWLIWWKMARPLVRPTTVTVIVLSFVMYWSDFVSPVLYVFRTELYTLPIGLQLLKQLNPTNWPLLMAAAAVITLPVLLLFIFLQRSFLSDLSIANLLDQN
ncbi:MAG: carbohydrate ABC transporter permease [Ardenticatenaceae bacterium]|nr:carbohydrate ABC transporter permease [Anaerolineales bacterium]MCB8921339.1 carbohydrate ABC transporter permease [Ardenticatenaceae bacterium]MCB9004038.1 carbohydrate ABC transporter permease [Ardenticatenaceae bacterium]